MMTPRIAVVVPYYQKDRGILARALRSVFAQTSMSDVRVIIVDDSSPMPAESELEEFGSAPRFPATVMRQENAGPASARNRGLDNLPSGTRYVAFLDSDDEWTDDHLARAVQALSQGYHFYFADHYQIGQTVGAFARARRIDPHAHLPLAEGDDLYAYRGDMFNQILTGNVIGTSTVVYDFARFPQIRFRDEFFNACEDYLCWMDFATQAARFTFSSQSEATYGNGVNIYTGAQWGTVQHLSRVHHELKYHNATLRLYPTTNAQGRVIRQKTAHLREAFVYDLAAMIQSGTPIPFRLLAAQFFLDPRTAFTPLRLAVRRLLRSF